MTTTSRLNGIVGGIAVKNPVRVATTANITLSGLQTIDSVTVVEGDRVLVKDQTDGTENGIYEASTGTWVRAKDFNGPNDVVSGTVVYKNEGAQDIARWQLTTADPITIGTSTLTFTAAETIISAGLSATSTTSLAIGTGSKVFTTQASKDFAAGEYVQIVSDADPTVDNMFGQITSYSGTTLTVNVIVTNGSGTHADWSIYKAGARGAQGATGSPSDQLKAQGSDLASASTVDLGAADSDYVRITGTTTIASFGTTTTRNHIWVEFTGILTLTYNGTSMILPTGADITTAAGDKAEFVRVSAGNWKCVNYQRASGTALSVASSDLVNDTTPQLGGQLDVNGQAIGDGTNELLTFTEDASAVNHVNIENEATGSGPIISAVGDDTNIDLNINPKGSGNVAISGLKYPTSDGTSGQVMQTDGAGNLSFSGLSVSQGDLNTSTGTFSQPLAPGDSTSYNWQANDGATNIRFGYNAHVTLPGGQYGMAIETKKVTAGMAGWFYSNDSNSYLSGASPWGMFGNAAVDGQQRYISSSPPFDMGDGEVAGFFFAQLDEDGNIIGHYLADTPPWGYNGPTDIRGKWCEKRKRKFQMVPEKRSREQILDCAPVVYREREVTQAVKNADMRLIPHPFGKKADTSRIVLFDPMDPLVRSLVQAQETDEIEDVIDFLKSGKFKADNEKLIRRGPPNINIVKLKQK